MNSKGVSTVVATVLMLGILVTVISVLNAYYFPSVAAESEIKHMKEVQTKFFGLASKIMSGEEAEVEIPFGSGGLPIISSISSSGSIIVSKAGSLNITLTNATFSNRVPPMYNTSGEIQNINSISSLMVTLENTSISETYSAAIDEGNKTLVDISQAGSTSNIRVITIDNYNEVFNETIATINSSSFFSLDILNPVYRFEKVLRNTRSPLAINLTGNFYICYDYGSLNVRNFSFNKSTGTLRFISSNNYWLDQEYIFENGAVILKQHNETLMRNRPFEIDDKTLNINLFSIKSDADSISGNGVQIVKIGINENENVHFLRAENITVEVNSENSDAWYRYFSKIAEPSQIDSKVIANFTNREIKLKSFDLFIDDL